MLMRCASLDKIYDCQINSLFFQKSPYLLTHAQIDSFKSIYFAYICFIKTNLWPY